MACHVQIQEPGIFHGNWSIAQDFDIEPFFFCEPSWLPKIVSFSRTKFKLNLVPIPIAPKQTLSFELLNPSSLGPEKYQHVCSSIT
jgi:hypothetical protein